MTHISRKTLTAEHWPLAANEILGLLIYFVESPKQEFSLLNSIPSEKSKKFTLSFSKRESTLDVLRVADPMLIWPPETIFWKPYDLFSIV